MTLATETTKKKRASKKKPKKKNEEFLETGELGMELESNIHPLEVEESPTQDIPENSTDEVSLSEVEMLQFRLLNTQSNLVKKNIETLELRKQLLIVEHRSVLENFEEYKKELNEKYNIDFDSYQVDVEQEKLLKIK